MVVCAIRLCVGLTQACLFPACHTLLGRWLPDSERTEFVGLIYGGRYSFYGTPHYQYISVNSFCKQHNN